MAEIGGSDLLACQGFLPERVVGRVVGGAGDAAEGLAAECDGQEREPAGDAGGLSMSLVRARSRSQFLTRKSPMITKM